MDQVTLEDVLPPEFWFARAIEFLTVSKIYENAGGWISARYYAQNCVFCLAQGCRSLAYAMKRDSTLS